MPKTVKQVIEEHQQILLPIIKKYIEKKTLLDVGCGNGLNSFFFNKKCGTIPTLTDIEDIRDKEVISFPFYISSMEELSFGTGSFDVVFIQYILHHLPPKIRLKEVLLELKKIGKIVIIVEEIRTAKTNLQKAIEYDTEMNKLLHPSSKNMEIYAYYSDNELKELFSKAHLEIIEEKIIEEGSEKDGFLQNKVYVLK